LIFSLLFLFIVVLIATTLPELDPLIQQVVDGTDGRLGVEHQRGELFKQRYDEPRCD
jgi:hypothetical protein